MFGPMDAKVVRGKELLNGDAPQADPLRRKALTLKDLRGCGGGILTGGPVASRGGVTASAPNIIRGQAKRSRLDRFFSGTLVKRRGAPACGDGRTAPG